MAAKLKFNEGLARIKDTIQPFSTGALYVLSNIELEPNDQARFEAAWPAIELEKRRRIVASLIELAEDDIELNFAGVFFFMLQDPDPQIRGKAIDGLWEDESRELLAKLLEMMSGDKDEFVREKATLGLSRFAYLAELEKLRPRWIERLQNGLLNQFTSNDSVMVRRRALEALGYFGEVEQVVKGIEKSYNSDDELLKSSAIKAMGHSVNKRWLPEVGKELGSPEAAFRYEAARAAGEMSSDELLQPLINLVNDQDREVQLAAIWSLGQIGGAEASRVLKNIAESELEVLATLAKDALAEIAFANNPMGAV